MTTRLLVIASAALWSGPRREHQIQVGACVLVGLESSKLDGVVLKTTEREDVRLERAHGQRCNQVDLGVGWCWWRIRCVGVRAGNHL